jgi:hypothetical protein
MKDPFPKNWYGSSPRPLQEGGVIVAATGARESMLLTGAVVTGTITGAPVPSTGEGVSAATGAAVDVAMGATGAAVSTGTGAGVTGALETGESVPGTHPQFVANAIRMGQI